MNFVRALIVVLTLEGGEVNNKHDRGGHTNLGITKVRYPDEDIKNMTVERASFLYKRDFWDNFKIENYPTELRLFIFDMYVNHSPRGAALVIQRAIVDKARTKGVESIIKVDGKIGPKTMQAMRRYTPEQSRLAAWRLKYYADKLRADKDQIEHFYGWTMRVHKLQSLDDYFLTHIGHFNKQIKSQNEQD